VPVVVHENFRFQPWHREAKRLIDAGALGTVFQASFRLRPGDGQGPRAYLDRQPYFQTMERFLVHETAIHFVDVFRFLLGEASGVFARLRRLNPAIRGEDSGVILFDFAGGARALFDGNRLADHAARDRRLTMGEMWIEGERGTLRLDGDGRLFARRHGENDEAPAPFAWDRVGFAGDYVGALQRHVVRHLRDGAPLENAAGDYLANLRLEAAIYESDRLGRWVAT
jgi:predicted dehydrogenase